MTDHPLCNVIEAVLPGMRARGGGWVLNITSGAVTRYDLNTNFAYTNFPNLGNQSNALAQPTAIAFGMSMMNSAHLQSAVDDLVAGGGLHPRIQRKDPER